MVTPSNCLQKVLLKMKNDILITNHRSFSKLSQSIFETNCFLSNDLFKKIFMVPSRGMLVNNEVMSRFTIKQS